METSGGLEFVNRGAELAFMSDCLIRPRSCSALIIVRSPAGFGKSRLTDQLSIQCEVPGLKFCVIDPSVRARIGSARLHDGFFLQRCAAELSAMANPDDGRWPTLGLYLRARRWKTAVEKRTTDAVSELPSFGHAYRLAFDYASRLFAFGRFSSEQLLASDQSDAVRICTEYVERVLKSNAIVLIVREAQHIDMESLRLLIYLNQTDTDSDLILEYTTDTGQFEPEHQKQFLRIAEIHRNFHILDLLRLEPDHLECLIRHNIKSDFVLTSDFYLSWNGNLRSIVELRFRVSIGQQITQASQIGSVLGNLTQTLEEHINRLSSLQRLILALALAHVEAIGRWTLIQAVSGINPHVAPLDLDRAIKELIELHGFLAEDGSSYRIQNDTIATALAGAPSVRPLVAIAEKALRDHYTRLIDRAAYGGAGVSIAVRQLFRLCARTKDAAGLIRATNVLSEEVRRSQDQTIYVDVVATAIEGEPSLYAHDYDDLVLWAASLAYEVCDWERCASLLAKRMAQDSFSRSMRAFALQEIGRHDEALSLAAEVREHAVHSDEHLTADLIEAIIAGCRGEHETARLRLTAIICDTTNENSPLLGYAYRFFEVIADYNESLTMLRASVEWFDRFGFKKSKAYSELPTAIMMARMGDIDGARSLISLARRTLESEIRDQHIILNNGAAIEMLCDAPDFAACKDSLSMALRYARDDHSELTIVTNLAIAHSGLNEGDAAIECVDKALGIIKHHDFADKDIYWPVCFNAWQILSAAGLIERATEALAFPRRDGRVVSVNPTYWAYQFGETMDVDDHYKFLASRPRHTLYLSHWLIDVDGLNLLKRARLQ